jgi:FkbM family methyltransferase
MEVVTRIKNKLLSCFCTKKADKSSEFYSHYGEDMVLNYVFQQKENGFYVDVGCYHPDFFSNTKKLYKMGWSGINIDANNDTIDLFNKNRPGDTNLNYAISEKEGEGEYFKFTEIDVTGGGSGNSLSLDVKKKYELEGLKAKPFKIKMMTLAKILESHAANKTIDFLNIDVEGFDLQVLKSNNWSLFRPKIIAVEIWHKDIEFDSVQNNEIYKFLCDKNYKAFSVCIHTWFFYDLESDIKIK